MRGPTHCGGGFSQVCKSWLGRRRKKGNMLAAATCKHARLTYPPSSQLSTQVHDVREVLHSQIPSKTNLPFAERPTTVRISSVLGPAWSQHDAGKQTHGDWQIVTKFPTSERIVFFSLGFWVVHNIQAAGRRLQHPSACAGR